MKVTSSEPTYTCHPWNHPTVQVFLLFCFPPLYPLMTVLFSESPRSMCPIHFLCPFLIVHISTLFFNHCQHNSFHSFAYLQYLCLVDIMLFSVHVPLRLFSLCTIACGSP